MFFKNTLDVINQGDCLEASNLIPDGSIDMVLTDPPFGVTKNECDKKIAIVPFWYMLNRVIKHNGAIVIMATQPYATELIMHNQGMFRYELIWKKNKVSGFLNANKMPLRRHENILVFYKKLPTYNPQKTYGHRPVNSFTKHNDGTTYGKTKGNFKGGGQTSRYPTSIIDIPVINNDSEERIHPLQKPVALFEWLIKTYTHEGDIVFDPCAGGCTMAIAATTTNRSAICIEKDVQFVMKGVERFEKLFI